MKTLSKLILAASLLAGSAPGYAGEYLLVANRGSLDLSVIRLQDRKLVTKMPLHETGKVDDIAVSPDGEVFFANIQIDVDEGPLSKPRGEIIAFSSRTGQRIWTHKLSGTPHHITLSADGKELFVPLFDGQRIEIIDTQTGTKTGSLYARMGMHTTRLSKDGKTLYAGSIFTGQVYAFDIATRALVKKFSFQSGEFGGIAVRPFTVTGDDKTIYAQLSGFHGLATLDTKTNKVTSLTRHGDLPKGFVAPDYPYNVDHGLELSPDQKTLVAVSESTRKAYVYSVNPMVLKKTIDVGRISKWVSFAGDGGHAYISNAGDGNVSVISMKSLTEVDRVDTGGTGGAIMRVAEIPDAIIEQLSQRR